MKMQNRYKILWIFLVTILLIITLIILYQKYYKYDFCLGYQDEEIIYRKSIFNKGWDVIKTPYNHCFNFYEDASFYQLYVYHPVYNSYEETLEAFLTFPKGKQDFIDYNSNFTKKWAVYQILKNKNLSLEMGDKADLFFVNSIVNIEKVSDIGNEIDYEITVTKRDFPYLKQRTAIGELT